MPYYVNCGKGINDIEKIIETDIKYDMKGSYNITYVSEFKTNLLTYLIALVNPNWDLFKEEELYPDIDIDTDKQISKVLLTSSRITSKLVALDRNNLDYKTTNERVVVIYKQEGVENDIEVGDIFKKIDGVDVVSNKTIMEVVKNHKKDDVIKIEVINNGKEYTRTAKLYEAEGDIYIGITTLYNYDIESDINIDVKYSKQTYGSSGSFMVSLMMYDILNEFDLSHGLKIAGTGSLDKTGAVHEIAGVKYKLKGAVNDKADIFFVPNENNYDEAIKEQKKHNYDIKIIGIDTIDDAIKYLENYGL